MDTGELVKDPVCGMEIDPAEAAGTAERDGVRHFFCSPACARKFRETPPAPAGAVYTCPMHPEVRQAGPGACPKCGMSLEPAGPSPEDETDPESKDMARRFRAGAALSFPLLVVAMADMIPGLRHVSIPGRGWIEFALATPVVLWAGAPFFRRGWDSVRRRSLNMFTLIALGTGAAYGFSLLSLLLSSGVHGHGGAPPLYFEAAAVTVTLVLLGQVLELRARRSARAALRALLELAPRTARLRRDDGTEADVPVETLRPGDRLRVRPGERVPVDGLALEGASAIDESMMTGESVPVRKAAGDRLTGGTLNGSGSLEIRAERVGEDTFLARIVRVVSDARRSRAPIQKLVDRVSAVFVPAVLVAAGLAFLGWWAFGPSPSLGAALSNAVAVLIIACPCALGLATPLSILVGTGRGAEMGVLIRDAEALDLLEKVDVAVFDKTGTLTEGKPRLVAAVPAPGFAERELVRLAAALERASEHPLAAAVTAAARERDIAPPEVRDFEAVAGKGVVGTVEDRRVALGTAAFLAGLGTDVSGWIAEAEERARRGETPVLIAVDGRPAGLLGIADPIKPSAPAALEALRREGLSPILATGDHPVVAESVARRLGIGRVHAGLLPEDKAALVRELRRKGHRVAMAGDGTNDAPALAAADVGIAMGTGTDVALESAAVTLVRGDLGGLVRARRLSRATMRNLRQNLLFAFAYNALGVPLAAGALYGATGWLLSPMLAGAAMSLSSVSVILNALRLRGLTGGSRAG